jgi:hypothetical protein
MDVKVNLEDDLKVNAHIVFLDFDKFTFRNKLSQCVTLLRQKKINVKFRCRKNALGKSYLELIFKKINKQPISCYEPEKRL